MARQQLSIPNDWQKEDGYCLLVACVPDSQMWRGTVMGKLWELTRGRQWARETGIIIDAQAIGNEIYESACMANCDDLLVQLTRIADAQEQMALNGSTVTIEDLIVKLDDQSWTEEFRDSVRDYLEILTFIKELMPFTGINLSLTAIVEAYATWRYRSSVINMLEDIAISERIQATAQFGTSGHSLYDLFGDPREKLLLPAGWQGKALWLWNRLTPDEIPSWVSWITDIAGLILGNINQGVQDIATNTENLGDIATNVGELEMAVNVTNNNYVTCSSCGGSGCSSCSGSVTDGPNDEPRYTEPADPQTDPPPPGFGSWDDYETYKCNGANVLVLNMAEFLATQLTIQNRDYSQYQTSGQVVDSIGAALTAASDAIGIMLAQTADFIGETLAALVHGPSANPSEMDLFADIRLQYLNDRTDAVCEIYNANTTTGIRDAIQARLDGYIDGTGYNADTKARAKTAINAYMTNQWINRVWFFNEAWGIDTYTDPTAVDCTDCLCAGLATQAIIASVFFGDPGDGHWEIQVDSTDFGASSRGCCFEVVSVSVDAWAEREDSESDADELWLFNCGNPSSSTSQNDFSYDLDDVSEINDHWAGKSLEYFRLMSDLEFVGTVTVIWQ